MSGSEKKVLLQPNRSMTRFSNTTSRWFNGVQGDAIIESLCIMVCEITISGTGRDVILRLKLEVWEKMSRPARFDAFR